MAFSSLLDDYLLSGGGLAVWDNTAGDFRRSPYGHPAGSDKVPVTSPSQLHLGVGSLFALTDVDEQVPSLHIPEADLDHRTLGTHHYFDWLPQRSRLFIHILFQRENNHGILGYRIPASPPLHICSQSSPVSVSPVLWRMERAPGSNGRRLIMPSRVRAVYVQSMSGPNVYFKALQSLENYPLASTVAANFTTTDLSARFEPAPFPPIPRTLPVVPPPAHLVPYSGHQSKVLSEAFAEGSCHPNVALRSLLDCILHSTFIANQEPEPTLTDEYSVYVLAQIVILPQCPPVDFSLFTLFVDKSHHCCLMCNTHKSSLSRALGCVRSHLGHRPFWCTGCQSCNPVNG
jgi:hypothetical protein